MADEIILRFSVKDDGSPVIEKINQKINQTQKESKALVPGLESARQSLTGFASANAGAIGVLVGVGLALKKAVDETMKYAGEVRDLSLATGAGAEESSRFLQVMDDFQVSASDVTAGMRAMKEQGLVPTIDTLAQLSDQFLAIEDPAKRLQFAQDALGRSSAKYLNVLSKGGDAIREMSDGISENLILTDAQIQRTEEYRLAMDNLGDTMMGMKVALVTGFLDTANANKQAHDIAIAYGHTAMANNNIVLVSKERLDEITDEYLRVAQYSSAWAAALEGEVTPALEDLTVATAEVSEANTNLLSLTMSLQSETDRYNETAIELHESQDALRQDYVEGKVNAEEYAAQMGELTGAVEANQKAHEEAGKKIAFSLLQQKAAVDGLSDAEFTALLGIGVQWGILDQTVVNSAQIMDEQLGAINESFVDPISKMTQANEKLNALRNMAGQMWTYYVNIETSGHFPNFPGTHISQGSAYEEAGIVSGQAMGGIIVGPGSGVSDSIMTRVSAGEFVVRANAVQQPGMLDLLNSLNAGGGLPGNRGGFTNYGTINVYANNATEFMDSIQGEL